MNSKLYHKTGKVKTQRKTSLWFNKGMNIGYSWFHHTCTLAQEFIGQTNTSKEYIDCPYYHCIVAAFYACANTISTPHKFSHKHLHECLTSAQLRLNPQSIFKINQ
jgi:hypothetical protein